MYKEAIFLDTNTIDWTHLIDMIWEKEIDNGIAQKILNKIDIMCT
jgi:hypothetical protein